MLQYLCFKDGKIIYTKDKSIIVKDWDFGIVNTAILNREELQPYIYIGSDDNPEAILSIRIN